VEHTVGDPDLDQFVDDGLSLGGLLGRGRR